MAADHRGGGAMISLHGLFEVHLAVANYVTKCVQGQVIRLLHLERAVAFYRDVLGLRLAYVESARQAALFWIGPAGQAMLGLCGAPHRRG